jgi:hypothetical protein
MATRHQRVISSRKSEKDRHYNSQNTPKRKSAVKILIICVTNGFGYVLLVASSIRFFPHLVFITGFVAIVTRQVTPVEQKLLTLPEHLSSPPVFKGSRLSLSISRCISRHGAKEKQLPTKHYTEY